MLDTNLKSVISYSYINLAYWRSIWNIYTAMVLILSIDYEFLLEQNNQIKTDLDIKLK